MRAIRVIVAAVAMTIAGSCLPADAADGVCDHCGCGACVKRVCVPKKIEKEVVKVCWGCKCEDVCIPGRSCKVGEVCGHDECGCFKFNLWNPTCARVKTRHIPVKTEVKRKVPAIEWVVEYRCAACCAADCDHQPVKDKDLPPAPPVVR